jgi:hypothetical protein
MGIEERDLEARLLRLEADHRRLKRAAGLLLLVAAALPLFGQAKTKVVEAERFVVRDEQGAIRANLGMNPQGGVGVAFLGQNRVFLGVSLDSAGFQIQDGTGKPRVGISLRPDGSEGLILFGSDTKPRVELSLKGDESPELAFRAKDGTPRMSLGIQPSGDGAGLLLMGTQGRIRGALASDGQGTALELMDAAGATRAHLGVKAVEGTPSFTLLDEKGTVLERHPAH